jgi:hypothetical protein
MEKRSRRRTCDLVTQPASQGLSQNEIGCVRISMMAKSMNALFTGRIQKRKTNPHSLTHIWLATHGRSIQLGHSRRDRLRATIGPRPLRPESDHSRHESEMARWALRRHQLTYSITSSAVASSDEGTVRPSALAALRLITSSNLVGCWIGRLAGFSPLRMRSTYPAAWRNSSAKSSL